MSHPQGPQNIHFFSYSPTQQRTIECVAYITVSLTLHTTNKLPHNQTINDSNKIHEELAEDILVSV